MRLTLKGEHIEWTADRAPSVGHLAALRDQKAGIVAILRGDSCCWCGERLAWPRPVGVILADGTAECMACFEAEAWRIIAAVERVVHSPDAVADPAELMLCGEPLP